MISAWLESNLVSIITVGASVIYFISKLESSTKSNKEFFKAEISHLTDLLQLNHSNLQSEIQRLKEKQSDDIKGLRENLDRLEEKTDQVNHVRERLTIAEASLKSLHKRLDVEPTIQYRIED